MFVCSKSAPSETFSLKLMNCLNVIYNSQNWEEMARLKDGLKIGDG